MFSVFEDGLSEPVVTTMVEGSISTSYLPSYVLDGIFNSIGEETISNDDDIRNYGGFGELSNKTDCDSGSIFYRYSDDSDDESQLENGGRAA